MGENMLKFKFIAGEKQINVSHKNQGKVTLVIIGDRKRTIIGQSELTQTDLYSLPEEISNLLPLPDEENPTIWECSAISQSLPFPYFYYHLYKGLATFGKQKKVGFIVVKLSLEAYRRTKEEGSWPYIIQLFPQHPSELYIYGVLPLKGQCYEGYQRKWGSWLKESSKKA